MIVTIPECLQEFLDEGCLAAVDEDDDSDVIEERRDVTTEVPPEVALIDFQNRLESYRVLFRY